MKIFQLTTIVLMFVNCSNTNCSDLLIKWNDNSSKSLKKQAEVFKENKIRTSQINFANNMITNSAKTGLRKKVFNEWLCEKINSIKKNKEKIYLLERQNSGESVVFQIYVEVTDGLVSSYYYFSTINKDILQGKIEKVQKGYIQELYEKDDIRKINSNNEVKQDNKDVAFAVEDIFIITLFKEEKIETKSYTGSEELDVNGMISSCSKILNLIHPASPHM